MCDENILAKHQLINKKCKSTPTNQPKVITEYALYSIGINFGVLAENHRAFNDTSSITI